MGIPDVSLTPSPCNFLNTLVDFTNYCTVTVTNNEPITLHISGVQTEFGPFSIYYNSCNTSLLAHQSCYVGVKFMPLYAGRYDGWLKVTDDARDSTSQVDQLIGVGIGY